MIKLKQIIFIMLAVYLITTPFVHAVVLESGIPNTNLTSGKDIQGISIAQYINYIYLFVLGVVGIAVFASLVFWGVVWISSGIADRRGEALGKIKDAFTGLAIALGAYIILNTINPDLLTLKDLSKNPVSTTAIGAAVNSYFWLDIAKSCGDMSGATDTEKSNCQNMQCNSGACMSNDTIKCCSMLKYKNLDSLNPNLKREWYCTGAVPINSERVDDSECAGIRKPFCGLLGSATCFREVKP